MDLVSVIIPYHKKRNFISETVESVLEQSYKNLEVIIVYDDDNEDDINFIKEIKKRDNRILVIKNKKKIGAGASRNIGISKSKGKYIACLDADDVWNINKVIGKRFAKDFLKLDELLKSCDIGTSTVIMKKSLINDNIQFASLITKEDFVLWLKLLKENIKIYGLNEYLTNWTKSKNSLSSSTIQKLIDGFNVYYKFMNFGFTKSIYYLICLSLNFLKK